MKQRVRRKAFMAGLTALLMALGIVCPVLPAGESWALEAGVNPAVSQAVDQGVTYFYTDLKGYKNAVEIVGIDAPNGPSTLKIPEKLNGKTVESIHLDFFKYSSYPVTPRQYEATVPIRKIILPKNIRSLRDPGVKGKLLRLSSLADMQDLTWLESIETVPGSKYVKAKDGILYSADMREMIAYPVKNKTKTYKMPSSVTWSAGICSNPYLKKIIFSKNKKYNNPDAYDCDNLESIYLPDNITKIIGGSFQGCISLKTIRWSKNLKTIGENAFQNCNALTKVTIPGKVRKIEKYAFRWCWNLKTVTLPGSVAHVGGEGFGKTKNDYAKGAPKVKIKKAPYLYSVKSKKVKKIVSRDPVYYGGSVKYFSVITAVKDGKTKYYDAEGVFYLRPLAKKINLRVKKTKRIIVSPDVWEGYMKGWKVKPDILKFTSSNPKVAKVTVKGVVRAQKKGKATITVKMKTNSVKCKVKVTVR